MPSSTALKVAVVHDYVTQQGGAERVVLAMLAAFPGATLYTSVYDAERTYPAFEQHRITTSWLQQIAPLRRDPRRALALLAPTFGRLTIDDADVVLCSSSGWSHGVRTTAPKLVYCYNPPRWLHQREDYVSTQPAAVRSALKLLRPYLLRWDRRSASTAQRYLTSSSVVQKRIQKAYGIAAQIVPPPIGLAPDGEQEPVAGIKPGYFLIVGRARGYKNVDLACAAFAALPEQRLVVVGGKTESAHTESNVRTVSGVSDAQLRWLYAHCRAVLALAHEDFGLTPLEGNALGRPALVLRAGGFLDTVVDGVNGLFIEDLSEQSVIDGVVRMLNQDFEERAVREHAARYSHQIFTARLQRHVAELYAASR